MIVPITVVDLDNQVVTGLDKENFEIFDDKVQQKVLSFSTEDAPAAVGMIFDTSSSMADKIQNSKEAALRFFKTSNPDDQFMQVAFASRLYSISDIIGDYEKLLNQALFAESSGKTALLDAIYMGLANLKRVNRSRKALLIISDGGENHSRHTFGDIRKLIKESDVQIYTIGIFEPPDVPWRTPEEAAGPAMLADLAHISGGRAYSMELPDELPYISEEISLILRTQYVIGYEPSNLVRDGRWRHIKIKLHLPD